MSRSMVFSPAVDSAGCSPLDPIEGIKSYSPLGDGAGAHAVEIHERVETNGRPKG